LQLFKAKQHSPDNDVLSLRCGVCGAWRWKIPLVQPVRFQWTEKGTDTGEGEEEKEEEERPLAMEPYALGVVLGGMGACSCDKEGENRVTVSADMGVEMGFAGEGDMNFVMKSLQSVFSDLQHRVIREASILAFGRVNCCVKSIQLMKALEAIGTATTDSTGRCSCVLSVPETYLRSAVSQRLRLLQGIMDACGQRKCAEKHHTDFDCMYSRSHRLMASVSELVLSLGGLAYKSSAVVHLLSMELFMPPNLCPYSMPHKALPYQEQYERCSKTPGRSSRQIVDIYPCRATEVMCISVAASDHLYVCEHYAVTHNTIQAISCAAMYQSEWPVLVIAPPSARHHWQGELNTWLSPELLAPSDIFLAESANHCLDAAFSECKFVIVSYAVVTRVSGCYYCY
jgi:hypothetical protein